MGLASCRPVETEPEKLDTSKGRSVIFNVQVEPEAETKTALRLKFVPDWRYTDTDDIHIFETASTDGVASQILKANHVDIFTEDNDQKAYFHAWFDDISVIINPSGVLTKASAPVYNYTSIMSATEKEGDELRFVLPSTQYPTSTSSFDPKADFLIGKCGTTYKDFLQPDQRLNLNFIRPVAIGRFAIVGLEGSNVESVKVTFEQPIAGYTTYGAVDFEESTAEFTSDESDKVLTLLYPEGRRKSTIFNAFFLALEGRKKAVSMEVRTDSYIFTKTYPNTTWTLNKDVFNEIVIDMSTATKTALLDQQMQFKDGEGTPVSEMTYDLLENGGSIDAFDSPVFSRDSECQSEVTFASDNEAVATVDADGNIALTGAAGVAVITASADGDATHKAGEATVTITVLTPEVTFYKANAIDNGVEYLIVANSKAVKHVEAGMGFEDVTVSEGTITLDNSLLEGLLWKAAAIDAASEFAAYGTHTFACGDSKLTRESDGEGHMSLVSSVAAMSKYMAWSYNGTNFWNHSVNGEQVNDFYLTYDTTNGWIFEYQTTPTAVLFTTLKPREIAFETESYTYDRYTDDNFVAPTIEGATYTSSDPDIAEVDPATGAVTIEGGKTKTGTVTITATVAAGNGFQGASASYTIVVGDSEPAPIGKTLTMLLEPATELVAGEEYFLVSNGKVLARDGSDAVAADFDATEVAALVPSELVDNVTWTLGIGTATTTSTSNPDQSKNIYNFTNGGYLFGIAMDKSQTTYTYSVELSQTVEISANVSMTNHDVDMTNSYLRYIGNSSSYYIYYNTTSDKWVNEKISNSASVGSQFTTNLYVARDIRDEQIVNFIGADEQTVTALTYDLASDDAFVSPELSSPYYGDVTYSTDDTKGVISLNTETGAVTINKKGGPVTITATIAGNESYKPATASYTLTVTNSKSVTPEYALVESSADIEVGAKYLLVNESNNKVFKPLLSSSTSTSFTASSSNALSATIENHTIVSDEFGDCELTLEDGYYFNVEALDRYLYPTSSGIGAESTPSSSHSFSVSISSGVADISRVSNNTTYRLRWTSQGYFQGSSNSANCQLYKLQDARQPQYIAFVNDAAEYDVYTSTWTVEVPALDITGVATSVVYESLNEDVATVDSNTGVVTIAAGAKNNDTAVISAIAVADASYKKATATYTITIVDSAPKNRNLAFTPSEVSVNIYGETLPYAFAGAPTLSGKTDGVTYSVSCSDTEIASDDYPTVSNTGAVTIVGAVEGVFTITASAAATDALQAGEASYTLTVTNDAPPTYTQISTYEELVNGTYIVVSASRNWVYQGTGSGNNFKESVSSTSGNFSRSEDKKTITVSGDVAADYEFVVTRTGDFVTLHNATKGYIYWNRSSDSGNYISVGESIPSGGKYNGEFTIDKTYDKSASGYASDDDVVFLYVENGTSKEYLYSKDSQNEFKIGGSGAPAYATGGVLLYKKN